MAAFTIRSAGSNDYGAISELLKSAGLPIGDVSEHAPAHFYVALGDDGVVLGCVGIERYGPEALLRSLAVSLVAQGQGVGAALVATVEREAAAAGVERLFLLTTSAQAYFEACGYRVVDRGEASSEVRATTQFASLCPSSAACMMKRL